MTAQQTSVATQSDGLPGMLADMANKYAIGRRNIAAAEIPMGAAVKIGTDPDVDVAVPTAQSSVIHGVALHSHAYAKDTELGTVGLKQYVSVSVLRKGVVKVYCSEQVVVGTSGVRIRIDTNAGSDDLLGPGTFCVSSSAGHTILVTSGMKWIKGCGAGGIAWLEVDMTSFAKTND